MDYLELFRKLETRTEMFIDEKSYPCITSFLIGYGCANVEIFKGFREWLTYKYNAPNNLTFSVQIKFIFLGNKYRMQISQEDELGLISYLFELFYEFDQERKDKGLEYIYEEHNKYMKKQLED